MDLWMYLVVIGMFLIATVGTVWITLWTIQRGEARRKAAEAAGSASAESAVTGDAPAPRVVRTVSTRTISTRPPTDAANDATPSSGETP
jgi:hypothetical protein